MDSFRLLLHEKTVSLLLSLRERSLYLTRLAKESGLSYSYVSRLIATFEKEGFVVSTREGRERRVSLSEKGVRLVQLFLDLYALLREEERPPVSSDSQAKA